MSENVRFRYLRKLRGKDKGQLVGCLAVDVSTGKVGWSYCSKQDRFVKEVARNIATARLLTGTHKQVPFQVQEELEKTKVWLKEKLGLVVE
jgi:hypothetical protein